MCICDSCPRSIYVLVETQFVLALSRDVDWEEEKACFRTVAQALAALYAVQPQLIPRAGVPLKTHPAEAPPSASSGDGAGDGAAAVEMTRPRVQAADEASLDDGLLDREEAPGRGTAMDVDDDGDDLDDNGGTRDLRRPRSTAADTDCAPSGIPDGGGGASADKEAVASEASPDHEWTVRHVSGRGRINGPSDTGCLGGSCLL